MRSAERSDELATSLGGFYSCWVAYIGLELGLFESLRTAGRAGLSAADLAGAAQCAPAPIAAF